MGGCRCTYKNCSLKSDGVTHMFHYPVFDKVRCHQWLTNAQKLEFLNLKVSQLKNRVVCQHHFKDDNFMNFLKDKLTFDAVPTLDGPYCDSSQFSDKNSEQDVSKLYSISLEDIENEYLTFNDKKANFSVKYGDFLTNCDLMDLDSMNVTNDNTQIIMKDDRYEEHNNIILNDNIDRQRVPPINPFFNKVCDTLHTNDNNVLRVQVTEMPQQYNTELQGNVNNQNINVPQPQSLENNVNTLSTHNPKEHPRRKHNKMSKVITILDEKKILDPVTVPILYPVKLEPICPSAILTLSNKKKNLNLNLQLSEKQNNNNKHVGSDIELRKNTADQVINFENNINVIQPAQVPDRFSENLNEMHSDIGLQSNITNKGKHMKVNKATMQNSQTNIINRVKDKKVNHSLLKNKIPPERMAAIEEKRKFNMKLRDIIASCLDKLDDEEANDYNNSKVKSKMNNNITQKVSSYLSKEPELPSMQDYTVAYLEARMKKMEDILLNKIDQNSRRIMQLQKTLTPAVDKKVAHTQTTINEELQKKHLYQEISKFLSPEANSLLYEELFINKYAQHNIKGHSPTKKRKYR